MTLKASALSAAIAAVVLGVWQLAGTAGMLSDLAPTPLGTWNSMAKILSDPVTIAQHVLASLRRVAIGFAIASAISIPLGFFLGRSELFRRGMDPFIQILRPVSPLAWLPLGLALLRDSELTALFVIVLTAMWPTLLATIAAVQQVNPTYLKLADTLGTPPLLRLTHVWFPAILPGVITGLRVSLSTSWLVIIAAEMLVGGSGIGFFVWNMWNRLDINAIVSAILIIGLVGLILDHAVAALQKAVKYD